MFFISPLWGFKKSGVGDRVIIISALITFSKNNFYGGIKTANPSIPKPQRGVVFLE